MRTSTLRRLCATLKRALPRQLLLVDLDAEHAGATKAAPVAKPRVLRVFQARVLTQPAPVRMRPSAAAWIAMFGDLGRLVDEYVERTPDARARLLNVCNVPHLGDTQTLVYWLRAQLAVVREREANRRAAMEKKRGKS
jgi:hypothetical protein